MDELLAQFLIEGPELVEQAMGALLALEQRPEDWAQIDEAFRAVHTLKGAVGLFDLPAMATLLHAAEDVLSAVRAKSRAIDAETIGPLLTAMDQAQAWLRSLEGSGRLPADAAERAGGLRTALASDVVAAPVMEIAEETPDWAVALGDRLPANVGTGPSVAVRYEPHAGSYFNGDDPIALVGQVPGLVHLRLGLRSEAKAEGPYDPFTCDLLIEAVSSAPLVDVKAAFRFVPDQVRFASIAPRGTSVSVQPVEAVGRTLRVDAQRIEDLAALVDELVSAKAGLAQVVAMARTGGEMREVAASLATQCGAIDRLVGLAHQRLMALRVAPVRPLLQRFRRVVREMAQALGKDAVLAIEGDGVEADRRIIEGLFEPLTHLLRNAVDHGVESTERRRLAGKPNRAVITLEARERGGRLVLTVRDDGAGIDAAAIRRIAETRGLRDRESLAAMDDASVIDLIFTPGFSTATSITALSGRGIGMDAIRSAVQRLGGRITIATEVGVGTSLELMLPLTVSLTKVMVVSHADERYGVPMSGVLETLRLKPEQVIPIRAGHAFNWRNRAIPLLPLSSLTGGAGTLAGDQPVLVVLAGGEPMGLAVDAIEDRLDVAMRPMDGLLAGMPGLAGTTVLGDGAVLMILDPEALVA